MKYKIEKGLMAQRWLGLMDVVDDETAATLNGLPARRITAATAVKRGYGEIAKWSADSDMLLQVGDYVVCMPGAAGQANEGLNRYVKRSHLKAVERLNGDLDELAREEGEDDAVLYYDETSTFTLSDIRVEDGMLKYRSDGEEHETPVVVQSYDEILRRMVWAEDDGIDGLMDYVSFWKACLRRAKRYLAMSPEELDKAQEKGEEGEPW